MRTPSLKELYSRSAGNTRCDAAQEEKNIPEESGLLTGFRTRFTSRLEAMWSIANDKENPRLDTLGAVIDTQKFYLTAAFESVYQAYKENGCDLNELAQMPDNLDAVLTKAVSIASSVYDEAELKGNRPAINFSAEFSPKAKQSFDRLRNDFDDSPFACIEPHNRWRMCVDPSCISALEPLLMARDNPLLALIFESKQDISYFHGMVSGWAELFRIVNTEPTPGLLEVMLRLHAACAPLATATTGLRLCNESTVFNLTSGRNVSVNGGKELMEFIESICQTIPEYGVYTFGKEDLKLCRPDADPATLRELIDGFIDAYKSNADRVDFCQKIDRLHPFKDGNCRVSHFMLNYLRVKAGKPLTMLDDPNILDGYSRKEVREAEAAGEARVLSWCSRPGESDDTTV